MKIIISGAVSNDSDYMEKFEYAEYKLRQKCPEAKVFNPAAYCDNLIKRRVIDSEKLSDKNIWLTCMLYCLTFFADATHIYYINDEYHSDGQHIEWHVAKHMGLEEIK